MAAILSQNQWVNKDGNKIAGLISTDYLSNEHKFISWYLANLVLIY